MANIRLDGLLESWAHAIGAPFSENELKEMKEVCKGVGSGWRNSKTAQKFRDWLCINRGRLNPRVGKPYFCLTCLVNRTEKGVLKIWIIRNWRCDFFPNSRRFSKTLTLADVKYLLFRDGYFDKGEEERFYEIGPDYEYSYDEVRNCTLCCGLGCDYCEGGLNQDVEPYPIKD